MKQFILIALREKRRSQAGRLLLHVNFLSSLLRKILFGNRHGFYTHLFRLTSTHMIHRQSYLSCLLETVGLWCWQWGLMVSSSGAHYSTPLLVPQPNEMFYHSLPPEELAQVMQLSSKKAVPKHWEPGRRGGGKEGRALHIPLLLACLYTETTDICPKRSLYIPIHLSICLTPSL